MKARLALIVILSAISSSRMQAGDQPNQVAPWASVGERDMSVVQIIEKLKLPVFKSDRPSTTADNFLLIVSATDDAGRSAEQAGFTGSSRGGDCRIYLNSTTPVASDELYDEAFRHLDEVVQGAGGIRAIMKTPLEIPFAHIWGDANAPWRCVAGVIYNVQQAGYPTVGFISSTNPVDATPLLINSVYYDLPAPTPKGIRSSGVGFNTIGLTTDNRILWNRVAITENQLAAKIQQAQWLRPVTALQVVPDADASYEFVAKVVNLIEATGVTNFDFAETEKYRSFEKVVNEGHPSPSDH